MRRSADRREEGKIGAPVAIGLGLLGLLLTGVVVFVVLRAGAAPPPPEIARDPLLVRGREVYLGRCVSCHGVAGKGDGPIAKGLSGPPPRDLTAPAWKHGEKLDDVLAVVAQGVKDTSMPGWKSILDANDLRGVTAYVYYLGRRPVPEGLRQP